MAKAKAAPETKTLFADDPPARTKTAMRARADKVFEHPPQNRQQVARVTSAAPPARESKATPTLGMLQIIADAVRSPKVDPDKMRVIFEMQKEVANEEARR